MVAPKRACGDSTTRILLVLPPGWDGLGCAPGRNVPYWNWYAFPGNYTAASIAVTAGWLYRD
jgi:hypothetical protein